MKKAKRALSWILCLVLLMSLAAPVHAEVSQTGDTAIINLKTDSKIQPVGLDNDTPVFSWQMHSNVVGQKQTAYQIIVKDGTDIVWDSGKVPDNSSTEILYQGETLEPQTEYTWNVRVWDKDGRLAVSDDAAFETGLMDNSIDAWSGAQWMGPQEVTLDANSMPIYRLDWTVQIAKGSSSAGFVFGANDPRLNDSLRNTYGIAGENYISYVLDVSSIPAKVFIYRVGYQNTDSVEIPFGTIEVPESVINELNQYEPHTFHLDNPGYVGTLSIDETVVDTKRTLSPVGTSDSSIVFPRLNDIGFTAGAGSKAVFTDVRVSHYNYPGTEVFGETTGAGYKIFDRLEGVSVSSDSIAVNGGDSGIVFYADPSFGSTPILRKEFDTDNKEIVKAQLYVTARGAYEYYINGEPVAPDEYLNPGYTQFDYTIMYNAYDVTRLIEQGANVMGATMAQGWFGDQQTYEIKYYNYWGDKPSLLAKLDITYADGSKDMIVTDESWKYTVDGPIVYSSIFNGETYDANKEATVDGWCLTDYNASDWSNTEKVTSYDAYNAMAFGADYTESNPQIIARVDEPVRLVETLKAKYIGEPVEGVYIYDMGTNMVGVPEITLPQGKTGQEIILRGGEVLTDNGTIEFANLRGAMCTDRYIMNGQEAGNTYHPTFTFHGYRYLQITGIDEPLSEEAVRGLVFSSVTEQTATFESSNELVNQLFENTMRSLYGNHVSIPTDCPQRDERMGWTGDAAVFSRAATYLADMNKFYQSWEQSMRDAQQLTPTKFTEGVYPNTVPTLYPTYKGYPSVTWPSAGIIPVWESYQQYGNLEFVREHLNSMVSLLEAWQKEKYNGRDDTQYLTDGSGLAEHLAIISSDSSLISNALYIYCLRAVATMAEAVDEMEISEEYRSYAENVKAEWQKVFIDPDTGKTRAYVCKTWMRPNPANHGELISQDTQGSYAAALYCGAVEPGDSYYDDFVEHYAEACKRGYKDTEYCLTTGFSATPYLLPALSNTGNSDAAYKILENTAYPSWLYPVTQGSTSIFENWAGYVENEDGSHTVKGSLNHYAYGAVCSWLVNYQAGITNDTNSPGFQHFILQPTVGGTMAYTNGTYDSYYGEIVSNWTADNGSMTSYQAVVPANTTATLYLPVEAADVAVNTTGAQYVGDDIHNGQICAKFELVSGGYDFAIENGVVTVNVADGYVDDNAPVKSASALESAQVGSDFDVTVVTASDVTDVRLYNANDLAIGRRDIDVVVNADGTKTWTITVALGTVGNDRLIKVMTKDATGILTDSGASVTIDSTSVPPVLSSFDLPDTAVANRTFIVKATTDMAATKINVYNEFGAKMGLKSLSYKVVDGQKVWTGVMSIGTKGDRTFTATAVNKYGAQSDAVTDSISVKAFA